MDKGLIITFSPTALVEKVKGVDVDMTKYSIQYTTSNNLRYVYGYKVAEYPYLKLIETSFGRYNSSGNGTSSTTNCYFELAEIIQKQLDANNAGTLSSFTDAIAIKRSGRLESPMPLSTAETIL